MVVLKLVIGETKGKVHFDICCLCFLKVEERDNNIINVCEFDSKLIIEYLSFTTLMKHSFQINNHLLRIRLKCFIILSKCS